MFKKNNYPLAYEFMNHPDAVKKAIKIKQALEESIDLKAISCSSAESI
jgi:hypothetical protein